MANPNVRRSERIAANMDAIAHAQRVQQQLVRVQRDLIVASQHLTDLAKQEAALIVDLRALNASLEAGAPVEEAA